MEFTNENIRQLAREVMRRKTVFFVEGRLHKVPNPFFPQEINKRLRIRLRRS